MAAKNFVSYSDYLDSLFALEAKPAQALAAYGPLIRGDLDSNFREKKTMLVSDVKTYCATIRKELEAVEQRATIAGNVCGGSLQVNVNRDELSHLIVRLQAIRGNLDATGLTLIQVKAAA